MVTIRQGAESRLVFDRVEADREIPDRRVRELEREADLSGTGLPSVSWVYDASSGNIWWSTSLEVFFGFVPGVRGFSARPDGHRDRDREWPTFDVPTTGIGGAELGELMLAPVLEALTRPETQELADTSDLPLIVTGPDGAEHRIIVRAAPMTLSGRPEAGGAGSPTFLTGVIIDVTTRQLFESEMGDLVDRYRLLTEVSPDVVCVHQNGRLVYGNRAAAKFVSDGSPGTDLTAVIEENYGRLITEVVHPGDIESMVDRLAKLTEDGQFFEHGEARVRSRSGKVVDMEITSIRTTWNGEPAYQVILRDVSERRAAEAANRYRASLVANVSDAIIGLNAAGLVESWNEAATSIYGWSESDMVGRSMADTVGGTRGHGPIEVGRHVHQRRDGSDVEVVVSVDPLMEGSDEPVGWVVVCTELTDARRAEAGRRAAEERYEAVVATLSEGIILFDRTGTICAHNEAAGRILGDRLLAGQGHATFAGSTITIDRDGRPLLCEDFPHVRTINTGEPLDDVIIGVTDGGDSRQWLSMSTRTLPGNNDDDDAMVVCSFTDVTDRLAADAQLTWLAYHDSLTGLGNRTKFHEELEGELLVASQRKTNLAVLFIDLDRFKLVNDSFGHAAGDEVLMALAQRLKASVRPGDHISRFSGDEFVILCRNVGDVAVATSLANQYSQLLAEPVALANGRTVKLGSSIGVSFVLRGRLTAEDILQQADLAMFQAKDRGRSRVEVFDESLRARAVARLEIYEDLAHAVETDELVVHYQPIARVDDDKIVALEALVRWNHPARGLLGPMEFVPYAEETDLIFALGRWVLREACKTMAYWRAHLPGAESAYVTVNLSVHQLTDENLLQTIAEALADANLPPEALVMEVTESLLMSDTSDSIQLMTGIHEMGVGLAIDDFGTGYSSLAQLKRFPVKVLKIDKSFVDGLGVFANDEMLVDVIVQMGKRMGLTVLAEGVETREQLHRVRELGCDLYQGYLMSKPVEAGLVNFRP